MSRILQGWRSRFFALSGGLSSGGQNAEKKAPFPATLEDSKT
jgi:hypothetical protein